MNYKLDDLFVYGDTWAFTHIPKNAGANFKLRWRQQNNIRDDRNYTLEQRMLFHQPAKWARFNYPELTGKQFIAITRNPYSRMVDWFVFIEQIHAWGWTKDLLAKSFEEFVKEDYLSKLSGFEQFAWKPQDPQVNWVEQNMKTFRMEDQLEELEEYVHCKFKDTRFNSMNYGDWREYYTDDLRHFVWNRYSEDFIKFGYEKWT